LEATEDETGIMDCALFADGVGRAHLHQKAGGSIKPPTHQTIDNREHYIYQEGQPVFKWAVVKMAEATEAIMKRNNLTKDDISFLLPHQANLRIISATGERLGLDTNKVLINIEKYGNTTSATIPICLSEWYKAGKLKKGQNVIITSFGGGFTWGAVYLRWSLD